MNGVARVAGEVPEPIRRIEMNLSMPPKTIPKSLATARAQFHEGDIESTLSTLQSILEKEPKNSEARTLLFTAEEALIKKLYSAPLLPNAVPKLIVSEDRSHRSAARAAGGIRAFAHQR